MPVLIILLCLAGTVPADCTPAAAIEMLSRPATSLECAMPWQAAAELAAVRRAGAVLVIRCQRHGRG